MEKGGFRMGVETSFSVSKETQEKVVETLGSLLVQSGEHHGDFFVQIHGKDLHAVVDVLRNTPAFGFDHFVDLCGVDYLPRSPRFESVIHLYSFANKHRIRIRCLVPDSNFTVPSVTKFWKAANWQERESFDMYGILYDGHPKLDRILSPPETDVFPQRKDYALKGDREQDVL